MYCTRDKLAMNYLTENLNLILISFLIVFLHAAAHDWGINVVRFGGVSELIVSNSFWLCGSRLK